MERNVALDYLKLFFSFMIVGLHGHFLSDYSLIVYYLTVNGIFRVAVPSFLIINGFYFFSVIKRNRFCGWLKRVLILYLFWMVFYAYFWLFVPDLYQVGIIKTVVVNMVLGYFHLWYLSGMIIAGVLLFWLRKYSAFILIMCSLTLFLIGVAIQYLFEYHQLDSLIIDSAINRHFLHRNALLFSFPFFCMGYLIRKYDLHNKVSVNLVWMITVLGVMLLFIESYLNYAFLGVSSDFDNYLSLILIVPFLFIAIIKLNVIGHSKNVALYSSAIYFIHAAILYALKKYTVVGSTKLTMLCILLSTIAAYFIIAVNRRIHLIL